MICITWTPILIFAGLLTLMALFNRVYNPDGAVSKLLTGFVAGIPLVSLWNLALPFAGLSLLGANPLTFFVGGSLGLPGLVLMTVLRCL